MKNVKNSLCKNKKKKNYLLTKDKKKIKKNVALDVRELQKTGKIIPMGVLDDKDEAFVPLHENFLMPSLFGMFGGNVKQEQATLPVHTSKLAIRNPFKNAEL